MKLLNPFSHIPQSAHVSIYTDPGVAADLFKRLLGGEHGGKSTVINLLLQKLHNECKLQFPVGPNGTFIFEPGNLDKLAELIASIRFGPACSGRPDTGAAVSEAQPAGKGHVPGAAKRAGGKTTRKSDERADPVSNAAQ